MHDPDHEHAIDEALANLAFKLTDIHGDLWHFQPDRLHLQTPIDGDTLITVEQYHGPGEVAAYEPVGIACNEREALQMITEDYHRRSPDNDDLCPEAYALWSRGPHGHYRRDATITKA